MADLILLVGPTRRLTGLRRSCLAEPPFDLRVVSNIVQALAIARQQPPAAVVLFVDKDDGTAVDACRQFRHAGDFPLIVAARKRRPELAVQMLEAGADDFVTLDITPRELRARLRAHVRRAVQYAQIQQPVIRVGDMEIDRDRRVVRIGHERIVLSPKEFALLEFLAMNADRVVRRQELLEKVWELPQGVKSRTLDVHMSRLRQKLTQASAPVCITTVPGVGYKLTIV